MELTVIQGGEGGKRNHSFYSAPGALVSCSPVPYQHWTTHYWPIFLEDLDEDTQRGHLQLSLLIWDMFGIENWKRMRLFIAIGQGAWTISCKCDIFGGALAPDSLEFLILYQYRMKVPMV